MSSSLILRRQQGPLGSVVPGDLSGGPPTVRCDTWSALIVQDEQLQAVDDLGSLAAYAERLPGWDQAGGRDFLPVLGGGCVDAPWLALVFINPTPANISAHASWAGPRRPFVGTKRVWGVLAAAGLLAEAIVDRVEASQTWSEALADDLYAEVAVAGLYLTNAVKATSVNSQLPPRRLVRAHAPALARELQIVRPRAVICCGVLPFWALTHRSVRLADVRESAVSGRCLEPTYVAGLPPPVFPSYFPVGRGRRSDAITVLRAIARQITPTAG